MTESFFANQSEPVLLVGYICDIALDFSWEGVAFEAEGFLGLDDVEGWGVQEVFIRDDA